MSEPSNSALEAGLQACHVCDRLAPLQDAACQRCGSALHSRIPNSVQRTLALAITAAFLALPAHLLPVMTTTTLGSSHPSTILGGVVTLWNMGSFPIAAIIFIFSVVVPLFKLLALFRLCWAATHSNSLERAGPRTLLYRLTELIGPWSMLDIFVVAVLVALVHLTGVMVITPGWATVSFGLLVVLTMLAAESFDPRLIWDKVKEQ